MSEMNEKSFSCCPPPHQCPSHGNISMSDWMQYINTYIDVRARQIYDKLKGLIPGVGGGVTKIIAGKNITISPSSGIGDVVINAEVGSDIKDWIVLRDQLTSVNYKVFIEDGTICTEALDTSVK